MAANNRYEGIERYIFSDLYSFFLKYRNMDNTENNWKNCIDEANKLNEKYMKHPLAHSMIVAVMSQLSHHVENKKIDGLYREQWESLLTDVKKEMKASGK